MAYQKLQPGRITEMDDIKSDSADTVNLYDPINDYTLTSFDGVLGTDTVITDSNATFITDGVQPGDVVYNITASTEGARVVSVRSETTLVVRGLVVFTVGQDFRILKGSDEPAVLYIGSHPGTGTPSIKVITEGGDEVTFFNPPEGTFLPVQVKKIFRSGTNVTDVLALF